MNAGIQLLQNCTAHLPVPPTDREFSWKLIKLRKTGNQVKKLLVAKVASFLLFYCITPGEDYKFILTQEDPAFAEIINITKAAHLDENRSFIEDVYESKRYL